MSQYPPPVPPLGYATYLPRPDPRPTSVKVIAILAIIFGGFGVFSGACAIPQYMGMQLSPNPIMDAMRADALLRNVTIVSQIIHVILSGVELASGIGALTLKPWARSGLIWYAIINIATTCVGLIVNLTVVHSHMQLVLQKAMQANPQLFTPTMQQVMRFSMYGGYVTGVVFLIWPVLVLYYMNRPHVKAAFARGIHAMP